MKNDLRSYNLFSIYLIGFLFAFHVALSTYINSSFLSTVVPESFVGVVYIGASFLLILFFIWLPSILRRVGNYRTIKALLGLEIFALLGLIIWHSPVLLVGSFVVSFIAVSFFYFSMDIFLENFSSDVRTGRIRGIYLTAVNLAWIFAPLIGGLVLTNGGYWKIYLTALILLVPIVLILIHHLKDFQDSSYEVTPIWQTIHLFKGNKNLRNIFGAYFLLEFFYSSMIIYTPIYLNVNLGFSWPTIGLIFMIMLIPFVLTEFPLGRLADKKLGEKEILSVGFILMAFSTISLFFLSPGANLWMWAGLLFMTRVGASAVEVMCDTYFFKKVASLNANKISLFRMAPPLAYIIAPILFTMTLNFFSLDLRYLFLILGLIMLFGLKFSLSLVDTK